MTTIENNIIKLIANAGEGKSMAMRAIDFAKKGLFDKTDESLKKSDDHILEAHKAQTKLMFKDCEENEIGFSILLMHSYDHLMGAMIVRELAEEIATIYKRGGFVDKTE